MKRALIILTVLLLTISGFSQDISRAKLRATNTLIAELYFVYRGDTIDFYGWPDLSFSVDTSSFHEYPVSTDNFMKVGKSIYPGLIFPSWDKVKDTLRYYFLAATLKDSIAAQLNDTLFNYLQVKDSIIKYVTPTQLNSAISNISLDTITQLVTFNRLDSIINSIAIDTITVRNISAQVVRDTFPDLLTEGDLLTTIATKLEVQQLSDSLSFFSRSTNGFIGIVNITSNDLSVTYPGEMYADDYIMDIKATYDVTYGGRTIPVDNAIYDFEKDKYGFTCKLKEASGRLQYKTYDTTGVTLSIGGFTETDPIFNLSVAKDIGVADTTRWGNKLDAYTETDPVFASSVAKGITGTDTTYWNNKITTETDPVFSGSLAANISSSDTTRWGNAINNYTETDPVFSASIAGGISAADTTRWASDNSVTNEIQDLSLSGNILTLSDDPTTVDISQATAVLANTSKETNATHTGDVTGATALTIGDDKILEKHLKAVNSPTDEYYLTYESTTGDFEWQALPILNQNTTGSAGSLKSTATTGLMTITGPATGTTRAKTVRDANDTFLELGGSYTPTGTWIWTSATATWPTFNQNTSGSAATLTTGRTIYGNSFNGSANLSQIIASTYGGTGNGFTKFAGATTSEKTYTLPDANATILYSGGPLGTPSSATVTNFTGTASININGTVGATTPTTGVFTTSTINTGIVPDANDGAYIGTSTLGFSDLFLAEGGVINWDASDATITQTGDVVTLDGAQLKVTSPGNVSTSVLTTDGTQTITNKTITATSYSTTSQTLTFNATNTTMNFATAADAVLILTGNVTALTMSNVTDGGSGQISIIQNTTGGYGIASIVHASLTARYINGNAPTAANINSTASGHTVLSYKRIGLNLYITYGKF